MVWPACQPSAALPSALVLSPGLLLLAHTLSTPPHPKVLNGRYSMPDGRSPVLRSLVTDMLRVSPRERPTIVQVSWRDDEGCAWGRAPVQWSLAEGLVHARARTGNLTRSIDTA